MRELKPGDKVLVKDHKTTNSGGRTYYPATPHINSVLTIKEDIVEGYPEAYYVEENKYYFHKSWLELVEEDPKASALTDDDLTDLIDKVSDGRIMRGGTQGKYVVFRQDNDIIIQLFGAAKK